MKGVFTLGIYIAIGITGAAFGQPKAPNVFDYATSPVPISTNRLPPASDGWLPPDRRTVETVALQPKPPPPPPVTIPPYKTWPEALRQGAPIPPGWKQIEVPPPATDRGWAPWVPLPDAKPAETVVIRYGQGGRVYEHKMRFAEYRRQHAKVEVRGPCYSACTMLLSYVTPENLCIASDAFMAFHAVRSIETAAYMKQETWQYYLDLPRPIRQWIDSHDGSWQSLPINGYWFLRDRELWALGYPRCQ